MSPVARTAEFYAAEYEAVLRAAKWIGSLLVLAQGGQVIYDLIFWVPRMAMVVETMVEGGTKRAPDAFRLLEFYLMPLIGLASLLTLMGLLVVMTRSRLSAVVWVAGALCVGFWAFGMVLNKILLTPLVTIVSNMGG